MCGITFFIILAHLPLLHFPSVEGPQGGSLMYDLSTWELEGAGREIAELCGQWGLPGHMQVLCWHDLALVCMHWSRCWYHLGTLTLRHLHGKCSCLERGVTACFVALLWNVTGRMHESGFLLVPGWPLWLVSTRTYLPNDAASTELGANVSRVDLYCWELSVLWLSS